MKSNLKAKTTPITNGCGGNKGTKCYVEVYVMPNSLSNLKISAKK